MASGIVLNTLNNMDDGRVKRKLDAREDKREKFSDVGKRLQMCSLWIA